MRRDGQTLDPEDLECMRASLAHRGLPKVYEGSMPHVVLVDSIGADAGSATVYDHAEKPCSISLDALAAARARLRRALT